MTYSAVEQPAGGGDLICKLSLAASKFPFSKGSWQRLGPPFPVRTPFFFLPIFLVTLSRLIASLAVGELDEIWLPAPRSTQFESSLSLIWLIFLQDTPAGPHYLFYGDSGRGAFVC